MQQVFTPPLSIVIDVGSKVTITTPEAPTALPPQQQQPPPVAPSRPPSSGPMPATGTRLELYFQEAKRFIMEGGGPRAASRGAVLAKRLLEREGGMLSKVEPRMFNEVFRNDQGAYAHWLDPNTYNSANNGDFTPEEWARILAIVEAGKLLPRGF